MGWGGIAKLERVQRKAMRVIRGLENRVAKRKVEETWGFEPAEEKADVITPCKYPKGCHVKGGTSLFSVPLRVELNPMGTNCKRGGPGWTSGRNS